MGWIIGLTWPEPLSGLGPGLWAVHEPDDNLNLGCFCCLCPIQIKHFVTVHHLRVPFPLIFKADSFAYGNSVHIEIARHHLDSIIYGRESGKIENFENEELLQNLNS